METRYKTKKEFMEENRVHFEEAVSELGLKPRSVVRSMNVVAGHSLRDDWPFVDPDAFRSVRHCGDKMVSIIRLASEKAAEHLVDGAFPSRFHYYHY